MQSYLVRVAERVGARRQISSFADLVRAVGAAPALRMLAHRVIGREWLVLVKDLSAPLPEIPAGGAMRWAPLTDADLSQIRAIDPAMTEAEVRHRWREGQSCLVCWMDGAVAHYRWDAAGPTYLPAVGKVFWPEEGDTLAVDVLTHPSFRGRGIDSVGVISALHRAREQGFARSFAMVPPWNVRSLRVSLQKAERKIAGTVGYWGIGPARYYRVTGAVRLERGGLSVRRHG